MKKKSLLALLLVIVMILSLSACGGSSAAKQALEGQTIYCNGGTTQNTYSITFEDGNASLIEKTLVSAGTEDGIKDSAPYSIDSENIVINWNEIDEMKIPYTIENDQLSLDKNFKVKSEIENTLLGLWSGGKIDFIMGYTLQYNYEYDFQKDGKVRYEYDPYSAGFDLGVYEDEIYNYEVGNGEILLSKDDADYTLSLFFTIDNETGEMVLYKEYGVQLYKK